MLRRVLLALVLLVAVAIGVALAGVLLAKRALVALRPPLPSAAEIAAFDPQAELPVRISWLNTATQPMPRARVIEASVDPTPDAPFAMSYPAFVLEWADGRIFLVDLGMDEEAAVAFGRPTESLGMAGKIEPHGSAAQALGKTLERVAGVAFTHEHTDHVQGVAELCRRRPSPIPLFQGRLWVEESNYTTRPGHALLAEAKCLEPNVLEDEPLFEVPGFPGLAFFAAAGHTPGSQVFVAHVRSGDSVKTYVLTGDVVNQIDGARKNLPKPRLYSLLLVPEATERLDELRRLLGTLEREQGAVLLVSHDRLSLEASGVPAYR